MSGKLKIDESFKQKLSCILSGNTSTSKSSSSPTITPQISSISSISSNIPTPPPISEVVSISSNIPAPPPISEVVSVPAQPISQQRLIQNSSQHHDLSNTINSLNFVAEPIATLLKYIIDDHINKNKNVNQNNENQNNEIQNNVIQNNVTKPVKQIFIPNTLHQHKNPYNHGLRMRKM